MIKLIKKIFPQSLKVIIQKVLWYVEALLFRMLYGKETYCTADTLRCELDRNSKNFRYDVLGNNIPICCASHLVELLFWTDKILKEHGFSYMINYGTLLGAVRHHGGIIPWDTDIDLNIDKKDFESIYKVLFSEAKRNNAPYKIIIEHTIAYGDVIKVYFSEKNSLHVDLFCYSIDEESIVDFNDFKAKEEDIFPLREVEFYGKKVYAPKTLAPLDIYYGLDWNKYYYAQWGLFTNKRLLTEEKRAHAQIDFNLIHKF